MDTAYIRQKAKDILLDEGTGHDWQHALRVEKNARDIAYDELTADEWARVQVACWVHDLVDKKVKNRLSLEEVRVILLAADASEDEIADILHTIEFLSFSKNIEKRHQLSHVGEIVQDADRLDAIGAIGIARTFYYGGSQGHKLYHSHDLSKEDELTTKHSRREENVVDHFYEKLLGLEGVMNTASGKAEAARRTVVMRKFLAEFFGEVGLGDGSDGVSSS